MIAYHFWNSLLFWIVSIFEVVLSFLCKRRPNMDTKRCISSQKSCCVFKWGLSIPWVWKWMFHKYMFFSTSQWERVTSKCRDSVSMVFHALANVFIDYNLSNSVFSWWQQTQLMKWCKEIINQVQHHLQQYPPSNRIISMMKYSDPFTKWQGKGL